MIGRHGTRLLVIGLLLAAGCASAAAPVAAPVWVLEGATIHDGTGRTIVDGTVVIEGDRVRRVGRGRPATLPKGARIVDLHGKFLIPGLIDAHVHFGQTGFFEARPDYVDLSARFPYPQVLAYQKRHPERYYPAYLGSGITAAFDVGGAAWTLELPSAVESDPAAPRLAVAGPMLTPAPESAIAGFNAPLEKIMVSLDDESAATATVRHLLALGSAGIKLWGVPEGAALDRLRTALGEVKQAGSRTLVHATGLAEAKVAIGLGAAVLVHSVEDRLVDDEFLASARDRGVIYIPTLSVHRAIHDAKQALLGKPLEVEDHCHLLDLKTRAVLDNASGLVGDTTRRDLAEQVEAEAPRLAALEQRMAENLRRAHAAGITIAAGTDAGNPGQLHGLSLVTELEAMQAAGISAQDLLTMTTANGARAMNRGADLGVLAEGKLADLVVLARDPAKDIANLRAVERVMKGGRWVQGVCAARSGGSD